MITWYDLYIGPVNYFWELISIFGLPIFCLIFLGISSRIYIWIFDRKKITKSDILIDSFVFSYLFIMTVMNRDKYPQLKYVIAVVPLLCIYAGKAMADIFPRKKEDLKND